MKIINLLSNREKAILLWMIIAMLYCMYKKEIRGIIIHIVKILFGRKLFMLIMMMALYVFIQTYIIAQFLSIKSYYMKEVLLWFVFTAMSMGFNIDNNIKNKQYFGKVIKDNLKLSIATVYITNYYTYGILAETILFPILLLLVFTMVYAEHEKEILTKKALESIILIIVICEIVHTANCFIHEYKKFVSMQNIVTMLIPPMYTITYIPCVYLIALIIEYDMLYTRLVVCGRNDFRVARALWFKVLFLCNIRKDKLDRCTGDSFHVLHTLARDGDIKHTKLQFDEHKALIVCRKSR